MDPIIGIGKPVPTFTLDDLNGVSHSLGGWRGRVTILNFWSAECPWTERTDRELLSYLADWGEAVYLVPIAANKNEPLTMLKQAAAQRGLQLVLHDNEQRVADLYGAETTPHLFVVDMAGLLRYQGALDDVTFRQHTPTQAYLRQAVEALLGGRTPNPEITPAYGCTIVRHTL